MPAQSKNYEFFMQEDLSEYVGQWVAIWRQQVIASGADIREVWAQVREKHPSAHPFIARVPEQETMIF